MKSKIKVKDCRLSVKIKLAPSSEINIEELEALNKQDIRGLLKVEQKKKNILEYSGPMGVSLNEWAKNPISKYEFLLIISQITNTVRNIRKANLFVNHLMLDLRYTFINESTKQMHFVYMPLVSQHVHADLIGYMQAIAYAAKPQAQPNGEHISKFMQFLSSLDSFDIDKIEQFIAGEDRTVAEQMKKNNVGQSGFMTNKKKEYHEHYDSQNEERNTEILSENSMEWDGDGETSVLNEPETTLLAEENNETTLLNMVEEAPSYPTLERTFTGEKVQVNKPVFRIGKERSYVDWFIADNNAVSRSHADIITRGQKYFIKDLNSKNGTYINGTLLSAEKEYEISDGDVIKLANEEFEFRI